ncbi:MAG: 4-hydroxy-tetrahydrodipicolinate synthase [Acidobacteriota bacterium]|nr:4-hydroxy-tetrahydrodipicolinate synthase [Acidobacteriota bacterium]
MGIAQGPGRFGAVLTAMVTPFDPAGALDVDAALALARHLVSHGSDGIVVTGTTGESPVLTDEETVALWRALAESLTVPVVAGTGTADTRHSIERTRLATEAGVDGVLVVTPYYNRPSQEGLAGHFRAVAEATSLPVLLYDIPVRSGRRIELPTMLELARSGGNIVGVKDASGDLDGAARLVAAAPGGFELYSGDDSLTLALLAVGAVGAVSVESHWAGEEVSHMLAAFAKGDVEGAQMANASLLESHRFQSTPAYPNPLPAKAACRALGLAVGQCRPPMGEAPAELDEMAGAVLAGLGRPVPVAGTVGGPGG